jgi:seryl-tRNA synthetase
MLDLKFIRSHPEKVKAGVAKKQTDPGIIDEILGLDQEHRKTLAQVEQLRSERKQVSKRVGAPSPEEAERVREEARARKEELKNLEQATAETKAKLDDLLLQVPNLPHESVPEGKDESGNAVVRSWGEPTPFDFEPRDHLEIGKNLDLLDIERASKVSGSRFYYLKGDAVLMEFALVNFALDFLIEKGFTPVITPVLVKQRIMQGGGYLPGGEDEIYKTVKDDLYLIGTSEQSILGMHSDELLDNSALPIRYAGFSSCFRREAGSYGKDVRGIFRVHQFDKVEMFSFSAPEDSWPEHEFLLRNEEEIMKALNIPYRVVVMCTGDLGAPAAKKYDIEAWMPAESRYRETHSTSNCTDFQARRLSIRYRRDSGTGFVHTLNGTAVAIGRTLIAIWENYQQKDGSVLVPEALRPYLSFERILPSTAKTRRS